MAVAYVAPTAGGIGDWGGSSGTAGTVTLGAAVTAAVVIFNGYNFSNDTMAVTLDGNAANAIFDINDSEGDGVCMAVFDAPATGSSINVAWTGMDGGDSGSWVVVPLSGADGSAWVDTDTDVVDSTPTLTASCTSGDMAVCGCSGFGNGTYSEGTATIVADRFNSDNDTDLGGFYEACSGSSHTMDPRNSNDLVASAMAIVGQAAAGGGAAANGHAGVIMGL